jgi:Tol biopolymer transport system component
MTERMARATFVVAAAIVAALLLAPPALATSRVAFSRGGDIFTVEPDGSGARRVVSRPALEHMPTWSPDGRRIAFLSFSRRIVVVDADGTGRRVLYRLPRALEGITGLTWSPDGSRIAFAIANEKHSDHPAGPKDCGQIRWMWAAGGSTHVVVNGEPHITGISWSPDGTLLAIGFEHQNMTRSCGDDRPLGIATVRLDGSGLHGLGPDFATDPDWSPDGRWIAYRDWRRTCHACGEIWVVRPDGSRDHVLTPMPASEGGLRMPRYSPSGKRLVALGDGVVVLDHDGTIRRVIEQRATSLDW